MIERTGWLLELFGHPEDGVVLWLLGDDGERHRFHQPFPVTFYASGTSQQLRALWRTLRAQPVPVVLSREQRRDLFQDDLLTVLAVQVEKPTAQQRLFHRVARQFPNLTYHNADIPLQLRYAAIHGVFPLARCRVGADENSRIHTIEALDSPWDLEPAPPPLRVLQLRPNCDPAHAEPTHLLAYFQNRQYQYPLVMTRLLLVGLGALLRRHDPDLLLTAWGDSWLLPYLLVRVEETGISLPLNREQGFDVARRPEHTYFSYGQVIYRGPKLTLFGRWHIDMYNTVMFHDYGLEGVLEMARVTSLPVQTAARVSPGTGISAMQMRTALEEGVLVPWHKQQAERPKSALTLIHSDQGGLVYQPIVGLHANVAEIDFTSMYPSIMVHFNISPETVKEHAAEAQLIPVLGLSIDQTSIGLIPKTLTPLLKKRIALKGQLLELDRRDPRYARAKAFSSAHKWLLVTCFGYLGYRNARFGRIEAHEAVTAFGREALLRAKEAAEDLGFRVLHMYIDGMWVQKEGAKQVNDFQPLLDEILERTRLPIALDGIYRWIAFLPSRTNPRVPVANRYFGVFQDGHLKLRGIEARRRDTPPFIKQVQREVLEILAGAPSVAQLPDVLPEAVDHLHTKLAQLRTLEMPLKQLLVTQKLSRELEKYRVPSPPARAVAQLSAEGKEVSVGQYVRFLYTRGNPGVHAWDLSTPPRPETLDIERYSELFLRAAHTVLQPLSVEEQTLRWWLFSNAGYGAPPGRLSQRCAQNSPLFQYLVME